MQVSNGSGTQLSRRDAYLRSHLANLTPSVDPLGLGDLRHTAQALVKEQTFPSTKDEEWRFTDLSAMLELDFHLSPDQQLALSPLDVADVVMPEAAQSRITLVNGRYVAGLSALGDLPQGLVIGSLANLVQDPELRPRLSQYLAQSQGSNETFAALNTAGFQDAAVIWIPKDGVIESPIHLLNLALPSSAPTMALPRCLVIAEAHSQLTLVEEFRGIGQGDYFTNAVTELYLADGAQVNHTRLQGEGPDTFHIGRTAVAQAQNSQYAGCAIAFGARLARHNWHIHQNGPQTQTQVHGLAVAQGTQVADLHSSVHFTQPHGSADQLHKCIVDDRAHSIFNGKIFVPRQAQQTNANQLNRNLLLSDRAKVDTKPQLEIIADNVKCAHGATVSQLQPDEIFYLQSRGIDQSQAQRLLIHGFAMEIVEKIPVESVRQRLSEQLKGI
jgi:Fe-S cluster assembly protein SufD